MTKNSTETRGSPSQYRHFQKKKKDCVLKSCITCSKPFYSDGLFNRMCNSCKRKL